MQSCMLHGRATQLRHRSAALSSVRQLRPAVCRRAFQQCGRTACIVHSSSIRRLPIFPLGMVAFPTAQASSSVHLVGYSAAEGFARMARTRLTYASARTMQVPLTIFEARYRVLFSTLLAGDEG